MPEDEDFNLRLFDPLIAVFSGPSISTVEIRSELKSR